LENDLGECSPPSFQLEPARSSSFRSALELSPSLGQATPDKKGKGKENRFFDRFHDSPTEEKPKIFSGHSNDIVEEEKEKQGKETRKPVFRHQTMVPAHRPTDPSIEDLQRSQSHPPQETNLKRSGASAKWSKLRGLLPAIIRPVPSGGAVPHSVVTSHEVNITDELITGGLSTLMLGLWFEHDEKGHRRVPVLFHRLRIRISDSLHPLQQHKAVFRIECEYANGAARWVVYRQLRDFLSLHAHYTFSNAFSSEKDVLPEFPRTSKNYIYFSYQCPGVLTCYYIGLPYFKFLKMESSEGRVRQTDFALLQREALEDYLIKLIRAVVRLSSHVITTIHKHHFRCFTQPQTGLQVSLRLAHCSSPLLSPAVRNIKLGSSAFM
jgi:phospholipase D1/2